jgi:ElaB/YqjD/DUF883 family membrane-anchored ribosome-binding protein
MQSAFPLSEETTPMVNSPTGTSQPVSHEEEHKPAECPPDNKLPENSKENLDQKLDHAIEETFPTSDPISVNITKGGAIDYDQQDATPSPAAGSRDHEDQGMAENVLDQVRDALRDVTGSASGAARDAYNEGQRHVRQARERYPEAERYYQEGSRAISQRMTENPWLSLFIAGAVGYGLAWMIHGRWGSHGSRVPDYARTERSYVPHRDKPYGS